MKLKRYYDKDLDLMIGTNLNLKEFQCQCTLPQCNYTVVDMHFIHTWNILRTLWGKPIKINSGYRCPIHNSNIGGALKSQHRLGVAADLNLYGMIDTEREAFIDLCKKLFTYTKEYKTWLHVDVR